MTKTDLKKAENILIPGKNMKKRNMLKIGSSIVNEFF
jgi:hypothetical protein